MTCHCRSDRSNHRGKTNFESSTGRTGSGPKQNPERNRRVPTGSPAENLCRNMLRFLQLYIIYIQLYRLHIPQAPHGHVILICQIFLDPLYCHGHVIVFGCVHTADLRRSWERLPGLPGTQTQNSLRHGQYGSSGNSGLTGIFHDDLLAKSLATGSSHISHIITCCNMINMLRLISIGSLKSRCLSGTCHGTFSWGGWQIPF